MLSVHQRPLILETLLVAREVDHSNFAVHHHQRENKMGFKIDTSTGQSIHNHTKRHIE